MAHLTIVFKGYLTNQLRLSDGSISTYPYRNCMYMYVCVYIYYIYMYISWHICLKLLYNTVYVWITETRWSIGLAHILGIFLIYDMRPLKQIQLYTTIVHIYTLFIYLFVCLSVCLSIYLSV